MLSPVIVGSIGVGLLLLAFGLNLFGWLNGESVIYLLMNFVGALMAAWYAMAGGLMPLVILEGVWALVSIARLVRLLSVKKRPSLF